MEKEGVELIPIEVNYICDACKEGVMKYTGIHNGFEHKCPVCGAIKPLDYKYPTVRFKYKGDVK
jgi:DNA-directed RNA polymerase subunit RPC12/RpoP